MSCQLDLAIADYHNIHDADCASFGCRTANDMCMPHHINRFTFTMGLLPSTQLHHYRHPRVCLPVGFKLFGILQTKQLLLLLCAGQASCVP